MMNQVMLVANLGDNPEMRTTKNGVNYAYIRVCTSENYQDSRGEWQTSREWHTLKIWNKSAERAVSTLRKGDLVSVVGSMKSFQGEKARLWEISVKEWRNLSGNRGDKGVERPNDYLLPREPVTAFDTSDHTPTPWGEGFTRR
jgi:single-strand DNA-binding protein